jgi:predicted TIM-barrel fold metal-dependent hydrolase
MTLRAIDAHAHFSTREGTRSTLRYAKGLASYYMKKDVTSEQVLAFSKSDEDMAKDFIKAGVKGILVGWDAETNTGETAMSNDYVASMVERFPEAFIGAYGSVDPWKGKLAVLEAERCIGELGLMGIKFQGAAQGSTRTTTGSIPCRRNVSSSELRSNSIRAPPAWVRGCRAVRASSSSTRVPSRTSTIWPQTFRT